MEYKITVEDTGLPGDSAWMVRVVGENIAANGPTLRDALIHAADTIADFNLLDELNDGRDWINE
jgi:hypothetical protein